MSRYLGNSENYLARLTESLHKLDRGEIDTAIELIAQAWNAGRQIITLGNGGSAITALHMITDWNKMAFLAAGVPFRGRSLIDNMGLVMAYANDISFADVFSEQLKNILQPGDLVIAISGSGNSENVVRAINYANENGAITLGLCGYDGGKLKKVAQHSLHVNAPDMQIVEDVHAIFGHIVMQSLCDMMPKKP